MATAVPDEMDALVPHEPGVDGLVFERRPAPSPGEGEVVAGDRVCAGGDRTILGSKAHSHSELQEGVQLMIDGKVEPVITRTVSLGEATEVLREIEAGNFFARGVVAMD